MPKNVHSGTGLVKSESRLYNCGLIAGPHPLRLSFLKLLWLSGSLGNRSWDRNSYKEFSREKHQKSSEQSQWEERMKLNCEQLQQSLIWSPKELWSWNGPAEISWIEASQPELFTPQNDQSVATGCPWKGVQPWARQLLPAKCNI